MRANILPFGCFAQQVHWSDLRADTQLHCSFFDKIQTRHSQTQLHKEESLSLVKKMLMVSLVTAGVSDEVAQELQMPIGPHALEDVGEPTPSRPATLKDSGTPAQFVLYQHNLTHSPGQQCKVRVKSRERDSPHREQSKIDAMVPQLQFVCGYMGKTEALGRLHVSAWEQTPLLEPHTQRWFQTPRRRTCPAW